MTFNFWRFRISFEMVPSVKDECIKLILEERRIQAIKLYRERTFPMPTLKQGKEYIDKLALSVGINYDEEYKRRQEMLK